MRRVPRVQIAIALEWFSVIQTRSLLVGTITTPGDRAGTRVAVLLTHAEDGDVAERFPTTDDLFAPGARDEIPEAKLIALQCARFKYRRGKTFYIRTTEMVFMHESMVASKAVLEVACMFHGRA